MYTMYARLYETRSLSCALSSLLHDFCVTVKYASWARSCILNSTFYNKTDPLLKDHRACSSGNGNILMKTPCREPMPVLVLRNPELSVEAFVIRLLSRLIITGWENFKPGVVFDLSCFGPRLWSEKIRALTSGRLCLPLLHFLKSCAQQTVTCGSKPAKRSRKFRSTGRPDRYGNGCSMLDLQPFGQIMQLCLVFL